MGLEPTTATLQIRCAITVPCRPLTQQRLTVSTTLNVVETHCIYYAKCSVVLLSKTTATTIHNNSL